MSSIWFGFIWIRASLIPALSTWNRPTVLPDDNKSKTFWSSKLIFSILKSLFFFLINFWVLLITVSVLSPKQSNFISPAFSAEYMSNWVDGNNKSAVESLYKGTTSVSFLSAITTPAAWVATFRFKPSNFNERFTSFFTLGSSLSNFWSLGSPAIHSVKFWGRDGSKGIIFEILSTKPYARPKTLPTSLMTILAFNLPKVIIWATLSLYLFVKYSKTRSLFSSQKSISKSGIEILSGFKNLSNIKLNFIGSTSVIERHQATNEPAPDPLPGPTGISFFFAHFI